MNEAASGPPSPAVPALIVRTPDGRDSRFIKPFHVGRGTECEVRIDDVHVSRRHLAVAFTNGRWSVHDLQSSNGVFVDDERIETMPVDALLSLRLGGTDGPLLTLRVEAPAIPTKPRAAPSAANAERRGGETVLVAKYAERYFGPGANDEPAGRQTMMIRKAFQEVQKKQQRRYGWIVTLVALAGVAAGGYAYYTARQVRQQQVLAEDLFYAMKALDVDIAKVEVALAAAGKAQAPDRVASYLQRRRDLEQTYDRFLSGLKVYGRGLTEEERLILRVTRTLGECELVAPPEYLTEVATYIRKWQSTARFAQAVTLARDKGYIRKIAAEFIGQDLPPQFFYLAMQESDFDPFRSGRQTSWGIAKGMWQFIPETGVRYGLTPGPLVRLERPDPADDRSKWEKATQAAARYIKDIYSTDAQASGLLVIASYNWGEHRIIDLVRRMPNNPRERNFWKLLEKHQVPKETYDYVFTIVAAAVIGENPRLFGFPFDNPLLR